MARQEYFPDPHEEYENDDFEVSDDRVGGSPLDDANIPKRGSRKGLFGILIAVACVIGVLVYASRDDDTPQVGTQTPTQTEEYQIANSPRRIAVDPSGSPNIIENLHLPEDVKESVRQKDRVPNASIVESPTTVSRPLIDPNEIARQVEANAPATAQKQAEDEVRLLWGPEIVPAPGPEMPANASQVGETETGIGSDFIAAQKAREDSIRRAEEERRQQELEALKEAERQRLRSRGTLLAQNSAISLEARGAGVSRFVTSREVSASVAPDGQKAGQASDNATPNEPDAEVVVTPGVRVPAVLVSEFRSSVAGAGAVEARLLTDLVNNGQIILPAGTKAFGQAQTSVPEPGEEARVSITFRIFVTPSGKVLADRLIGHAIDPKTLALSVPANVDHNYTSRISRALLATGLDYLLTRGSQRRSIYEAESSKDRMVEDARNRVNNIVGDVGQDSGNGVEVYLPANTPIMIAFGLNNL